MESIKNGWKSFKNTTSQLATGAANQTVNLVQKTGDVVQKTGDVIYKKGGDVIHKTGDILEGTKETTSQLMTGAAKHTGNIIYKTGDVLYKTGDVIYNTGGEIVHKSGDYVEDPKKLAKDSYSVTMKVGDMLTDDVLGRGVKWAAGKATYYNKEKMEVKIINQTAKVLKVEFWLEGATGYSELATLLPGDILTVNVALSSEQSYEVRLRTQRPDIYLVGSALAFVPFFGQSVPIVVRGVNAAISTIADFAEMDKTIKNQNSEVIVAYTADDAFDVKFTATEEDIKIAEKINEYFEWVKKQSKGATNLVEDSITDLTQRALNEHDKSVVKPKEQDITSIKD